RRRPCGSAWARASLTIADRVRDPACVAGPVGGRLPAVAGLRTGSRVGPYQIVGELGAGGMGVVYRARDTRLGRDVAVKVLAANLARSVDAVRRFELEARSASALDHPNVMTIYDVGTYHGVPYQVCEP